MWYKFPILSAKLVFNKRNEETAQLKMCNQQQTMRTHIKRDTQMNLSHTWKTFGGHEVYTAVSKDNPHTLAQRKTVVANNLSSGSVPSSNHQMA